MFESSSGLKRVFLHLNTDQTHTKPRPNADQAQAKFVFTVCFVCVTYVNDNCLSALKLEPDTMLTQISYLEIIAARPCF